MDIFIEDEEYWQYLFDIAETEIELDEFRNKCIQESYEQEYLCLLTAYGV